MEKSTNDTDCGITTPKHKGVCPTGWHIPSNEDWDKLMRYVDGSTGTSSPYDSPTAGRYLKATDGWNDCGPSGSGKSYLCEDTKGFSALPGGFGNSGGSFYLVGGYGSEYALYDSSNKDGLFSVRCLQD